jgi:hypothetical protein
MSKSTKTGKKASSRTFVIGERAFRKISAIEGIKPPVCARGTAKVSPRPFQMEGLLRSAHDITPDQRTKIVSAIVDEGMSVVDASKTFLVGEATIQAWLDLEAQRLRQENQELKAIIGEMILQRSVKKKKLVVPACARS